MAEVVGSRVERRRKSARERRAQALRAEARCFRRAQAMGAAMAHRGDLFSERFGVRSLLRCGPQGRVSSVPLPCSAFPDLAIPVLAAQDSDGHDPKLVETLLLRSLRGREAELEALNLLVKEDVGQLVSVVSTFLVERCGRCTSWQTAGGPGRKTNAGHCTVGVASAGPPGVRGGSGLLGHCWHLASPRRFVFSFVYGSSRGYSFALVLGRGFQFAGGSVRGFNLAFVPVREYWSGLSLNFLGFRGFCVLLDGVF